MNKKLMYFLDKEKLMVYLPDGNTAIWYSNDTNFNEAIEMCRENKYIQVYTLFDPTAALLNKNSVVEISDKKEKEEIINDINGNITKDHKQERKGEYTITVNEIELDKDYPLVALIGTLKKKGVINKDIDKIRPFLERVVKNPFIKAGVELYDFCKNGDFEITEDGCIIAYKGVNNNLTSSNNFKNPIGEWVEEPNFDNNRYNLCSSGLHFCAKSYLRSFGRSRILLVKVQPEDIVAIPTDYSGTKARARKYYIVGEIDKNSKLATTDVEEIAKDTTKQTGKEEKVKIVKTKERVRIEKKQSEKEAKFGNRNEETAFYMNKFNNDVNKVATIMKLSSETIKRNMRRFKNMSK